MSRIWYNLAMGNIGSKQVFVAYPYSLYDKNKYRRAYKRASIEYGVSFFFADERITNMHILAKIRRQIEIADFSIFDISGWNPNVSLELGMAYVLPGVDWYICYNPDKNAHRDVPSDIRGIDRIQYRNFEELEDRLIVLLDQQYPRKPVKTLHDHEEPMREQVLSLLRGAEAGLQITQIAKNLQCTQAMAGALIKALVDAKKIESTGAKRGTRYRIKK